MYTHEYILFQNTMYELNMDIISPFFNGDSHIMEKASSYMDVWIYVYACTHGYIKSLNT